jgi:hypothetical protein
MQVAVDLFQSAAAVYVAIFDWDEPAIHQYAATVLCHERRDHQVSGANPFAGHQNVQFAWFNRPVQSYGLVSVAIRVAGDGQGRGITANPAFYFGKNGLLLIKSVQLPNA